ncbi:molybdenum cofactor guanylyltransferase [Verrucomicrobiota bacterium sgz303538]
MLNFPFSAALLAGGQSRRMGRDKAGLIIEGTALWERQVRLLHELNPEQFFICGRPDGPYVGKGYDVAVDIEPGAGPLGGLVTALRHSTTEMLLLLAVDMPAMEVGFLEKMLRRSQVTAKCVIPSTRDEFEPLAAVYRHECLEIAEHHLKAGQRAMRRLVSDLIRSGLAETYSLTKNEETFFVNVNTPFDFERFAR